MTKIKEVSAEDAKKIVELMMFPTSGKNELKTVGNFQYYFVKKENGYFCEYKLLYSENQEKLEDGTYDASIFKESFLMAMTVNADGSIPKVSNERLISLKD